MDYIAELNKALHVLPEQASMHAARVDTLFVALIIYSAVLLAALALLIAYFGIRYRAGSQASRAGRGSSRTEHLLEITWSGVLFATFLAIFFWSGELYLDVYRGPSNAITIQVVGKQWMWKIEHPDGSREINTLHIPVGQTYRLRITSEDVVHSFYVPALRLKRDAVPGMYNTAWFKATRPGIYHLYCSEYCGTDHSRMRGEVIVMSQADYQNWLAREDHGRQPALLGKALIHSHGGSDCHMGRSKVHCPELAGPDGRAVPLANGKAGIADNADLSDSPLQPSRQIIAGYAPILPGIAGRLSEAQPQALVAYLRSLRRGPEAGMSAKATNMRNGGTNERRYSR